MKEGDDVNAKLATMARKLEALELTKVNAVGSEEPKEVSCIVCDPKPINEGFTTLNPIKHLLRHHNHNITNLYQLHHSHIHQSHHNLMPHKGRNLAQVHINHPTKGTLRTHFRLSCKANKLSIKTFKPKLAS